MKISLVTTWPVHMDYPVFRKQLKRFRNEFHEIFICLSDHKEKLDLTKWIKETLSGELGAYCFDPPELRNGDDWRDKSIKQAYNHITGDWVFFTEPDFFIMDHGFFDAMLMHIDTYKAFIYKEQKRLHPACIIVDKEVADRADKDFSALPNVNDHYDHFFKFTESVKGLTRVASLSDIELIDEQDYFHMTGLTHNYKRVELGLEPTRLHDFMSYNNLALTMLPKAYINAEFSLKMIEAATKYPGVHVGAPVIPFVTNNLK